MNSSCFFMLLHTTETPNETFSCFCTRQKHQMKLFHASAHDRKAKKNFFMLLHTAERPKRIFHASAHCRKTKKKIFTLLYTAERPKRSFSCCCTLQKGQKEDFRAWRKSFPERFGISALGESRFRDNLLKIVTIKIHK